MTTSHTHYKFIKKFIINNIIIHILQQKNNNKYANNKKNSGINVRIDFALCLNIKYIY